MDDSSLIPPRPAARLTAPPVPDWAVTTPLLLGAKPAPPEDATQATLASTITAISTETIGAINAARSELDALEKVFLASSARTLSELSAHIALGRKVSERAVSLRELAQTELHVIADAMKAATT